MTAFEELGMLPELGKAVDDMDWTLPTDVQAEAIPAILGGGDVLMAAETGSGKTGAFCLPLLQIVWESLKDMQSGGKKKTTSKSIKWALNVYDRGDALAIADDGLLCQSRDPQQWHGSRATHGVTGKGKYYYEATVTDDGLCRIGWSTSAASLDLGTDRYGFGYGGTGKKSNDKQFDSYGESFTLHDTIGCMLDLDRNQITFSKNGTIFPTAFEIPKQLVHSPMFPAVVLKNAEIRLNFGDTEFKFPPPNGYVAVNAAESTVDANSVTPSKISPTAPNAPMCIILEPTRELAEQTHNQINKFKKYLDTPKIRNVLVVGSVPIKDQLAEINDGVDIITATPGRLEDFISTGKLSLNNVRFYILDEADSLLNPSSGCVRLIDNIHRQIPKMSADGNRLQMIVCSATLHNNDVKKMADRLMHFPQWVDLKGQDSVPDTVHHVVVPVDPKADRQWMRLQEHVTTDGIHLSDDIRPGSNAPETLSEAVKVLKGEYVLKAINEHKMDRCLIFCRTKIDCDNLEVYLRKKQHTCVCLHSDRKPEERQQNLQQFKDGKVKFLICTDVAARGIDIHGMPFVINVTLPDEAANYLHRIGRVGRADRMGLAISFVSTVPEKVWYHNCASRGKNCNNSRLTSQGGCAIWYDEQSLLIDVEEHLGSTITQVDTDIKVPIDEFDGRVVYGAKKMAGGIGYKGHAVSLASTVKELAELERTVQLSYLNVRKFRSSNVLQ